jgi:two-component system chemotaxis response regulator CheB
MTALNVPELEDVVHTGGLFAMVQKPFDMNHMKNTILEALEPKASPEAATAVRAQANRIRYVLATNCIQNRNSSLRVSRNSMNGAIYIRDGQVIHAECGELLGERALCSILNWADGKIEVNDGSSAVQRTILRDWQSIDFRK